MARNDIVAFAYLSAANVIPLGEYLTSPWRPGGFVQGVAPSAQLNRVWRQASYVSAGLAQFVYDQGYDVIDDSTQSVQQLANNIAAAIRAVAVGTEGAFLVDPPNIPANAIWGRRVGSWVDITGQLGGTAGIADVTQGGTFGRVQGSWTNITNLLMAGGDVGINDHIYGRRNNSWFDITTMLDGSGVPPVGNYLPLTGGTLNSGGSDPLSIVANNPPMYARIMYDVLGTRRWAAGCTADGHFAISDFIGPGNEFFELVIDKDGHFVNINVGDLYLWHNYGGPFDQANAYIVRPADRGVGVCAPGGVNVASFDVFANNSYFRGGVTIDGIAPNSSALALATGNLWIAAALVANGGNSNDPGCELHGHTRVYGPADFGSGLHVASGNVGVDNGNLEVWNGYIHAWQNLDVNGTTNLWGFVHTWGYTQVGGHLAIDSGVITFPSWQIYHDPGGPLNIYQRSAQVRMQFQTNGEMDIYPGASGVRIWNGNLVLIGGNETLTVSDGVTAFGMWSLAGGSALMWGKSDANGTHAYHSMYLTESGWNLNLPYGRGYCNGGGLWETWGSDARVKRDITPFRRGLAEIRQLKVVNYCFNGRGGTVDDGQVYQGLTAQDVLPVMPELVFESPAMEMQRMGVVCMSSDDPDAAGEPIEPVEGDPLMSLRLTPIFWAMLNAIQELGAKVEALEGRK